MKKLFCLFALGLAAAGPAAAANLTAQGASVNDASGAARSTYSNSEAVTLRQKVSNAVTSPNPINFSFQILSPAGALVFTQSGNSAPGTAGSAQSQLSGIAIRSFYTTPGQYVYKAIAALDLETVTQQVQFLVSSPNISLIYPPYGARGLSDNPLTFRWTTSGANSYRITVADNAGLYNPAKTAVASAGAFFTYPVNPDQPREQLVPAQVYYWKVEGLDASNNSISASDVYNFSLKAQASSQTRNVAVTALDLSSPAPDFEKPLNFKVTLTNTGSTTETNISLKMSLGGLPAQDSPKQVLTIGPGEKKELPFTAFLPPGEQQGLAVACSDLFDDNVQDNCKTLLLSRSAGVPAAGPGGPAKKLSYDEMFQEILKRLGPDAAKALEGYTFENLTCTNCSQDELSAIISAIVSGSAQLMNASVLDTGAGPAPAQQAQAAAAGAEEQKAPEAAETQLDLEPARPGTAGEWTGLAEPPSQKQTSVFVIKDRKEWKKVWSSVSSEEVPEVDFGKKMAVGVIAAGSDRAEAVRILGMRKTDDGIAFDYYVIEAPAGEKPAKAAYIFKLFDKAEEKAEFKRLDVSKQGR